MLIPVPLSACRVPVIGAERSVQHGRLLRASTTSAPPPATTFLPITGPDGQAPRSSTVCSVSRTDPDAHTHRTVAMQDEPGTADHGGLLVSEWNAQGAGW